MADVSLYMVLVVSRRVMESGRSHKVSLPAEWIKKHRVKPGDDVTIIANELVVVLPPTPLDRNDITRAMEDIVTIASVAQRGTYARKKPVSEVGS
ncbi:MAG: AbrB/MazE/SpoVT family DNA-binding domain-containing protein [Parcubacteria group bacterium]|jgi:antitoxin component of MazEF toxin-antitoxin module